MGSNGAKHEKLPYIRQPGPLTQGRPRYGTSELTVGQDELVITSNCNGGQALYSIVDEHTKRAPALQ